MDLSFSGYERRLLRHLIKKELKLVNQYREQVNNITGYCRTQTSTGLNNRWWELERLLDKFN